MIEEIDRGIQVQAEGKDSGSAEKDVSAIALMGDYILMGSDEGNHLKVLKRQADERRYEQVSKIVLDPDAEELDVEGIASYGSTVYVACSCSLVRKSVKAKKKTVTENLERLQTVSDESERSQRCQLFKFSFDSSSGTSSNISAISIQAMLTSEPILARFMNIPSKENGVDIEGIAVARNEMLYIGFRGPVLRGNYVPVLVTTFADHSNYEIRYICLGGLGVRDLTTVQDGFLIIGGPVGDREGPYELYFWDGCDAIPGIDRAVNSRLDCLGEIPTQLGAKAEGIDLIKETETEYQVMIAYDSLESGGPRLFRVSKTSNRSSIS